MKNNNWLEKLKASTQRFWEEEYPNKSRAEKLDYWKSTMEKGMKEQSKMGSPPFAIFQAAWYASVKEQEPEINQLINQLFQSDWKALDAEAFWASTRENPTE